MKIEVEITPDDHTRLMRMGHDPRELISELIKEAILPSNSTQREIIIDGVKRGAQLEADIQAWRERLWTAEKRADMADDALEEAVRVRDELKMMNDQFRAKLGQLSEAKDLEQTRQYNGSWAL